MALGDISALLPYFSTKETTFATSATVAKIAAQNPYRVSLTFTCAGSTSVFISTKATIPSNSGIKIAAGQTPVTFAFSEVGILTTLDWYATTAGGIGDFLTVLEVIYRPPGA